MLDYDLILTIHICNNPFPNMIKKGVCVCVYTHIREHNSTYNTVIGTNREGQKYEMKTVETTLEDFGC